MSGETTEKKRRVMVPVVKAIGAMVRALQDLETQAERENALRCTATQMGFELGLPNKPAVADPRPL
jgi:hypothetical protein